MIDTAGKGIGNKAYISNLGVNSVVSGGVSQHRVQSLEEVIDGQRRGPLAEQVLAGLSGRVYGDIGLRKKEKKVS